MAEPGEGGPFGKIKELVSKPLTPEKVNPGDRLIFRYNAINKDHRSVGLDLAEGTLDDWRRRDAIALDFVPVKKEEEQKAAEARSIFHQDQQRYHEHVARVIQQYRGDDTEAYRPSPERRTYDYPQIRLFPGAVIEIVKTEPASSYSTNAKDALVKYVRGPIRIFKGGVGAMNSYVEPRSYDPNEILQIDGKTIQEFLRDQLLINRLTSNSLKGFSKEGKLKRLLRR